MTTSQMIEYRITRDLLQRRDSAARYHRVGQIIKSAAVVAAVTLLSATVPELLLPIAAVAAVLSLGLN